MTEGCKIRSAYPWATPGDGEATQRFAKELVAQQPDLVLAQNRAMTILLCDAK